MHRDLTPLLAQPGASVAVVGASDNPAKYGAIIYRHLKAKGYRVFAVNPNRSSVDGDPCWPRLAALPERPTVIDLVVPPDVGLEVVEEVHRLGWSNVWLQPGAERADLLARLDELGLDHLADACIMVRAAPARVAGAS